MAQPTVERVVRDEPVSLDHESTVGEAIEAVRTCDVAEGTTIYYAYVTDGAELVGVVSLRELLNAEENQSLSEVMTTDLVTLTVSDSLQRAVNQFTTSEFPVLPVVDDTGQFVGVVRANDVIDELDAETTRELFRSTWPWGAG